MQWSSRLLAMCVQAKTAKWFVWRRLAWSSFWPVIVAYLAAQLIKVLYFICSMICVELIPWNMCADGGFHTVTAIVTHRRCFDSILPTPGQFIMLLCIFSIVFSVMMCLAGDCRLSIRPKCQPFDCRLGDDNLAVSLQSQHTSGR